MSTSTMHFGPEWMRKQPRTMQETAQPPAGTATLANNPSSYSAHVSPAQPMQQDNHDDSHPFRYSKEELLQIFKDGGGQNGLGLEVQRWEGVVREVSIEPSSLREMGDVERKLFATPLNSELRRRQSTDYISPLSTQSLGVERPRLNHSSSAATGSPSPLRERFGPLPRRRGESTDQIPTTLPRKLSLSSVQTPMAARDTGMPSPRNVRMASGGFDGVFAGGGDSWSSRRRASEGQPRTPGAVHRADPTSEILEGKIKEEDELETSPASSRSQYDPHAKHAVGGTAAQQTHESSMNHPSLTNESNHSSSASPANSTTSFPPGLQDLASIQWSYLDPQGQVQGPFRADLMQKWHDDGYFTPDLRMRRTHLDTEWTTVAVLQSRVAGPLFLTPHRPAPPPGLQRPPEIQPSAFPPEQITSPYQPSPIRSLRSSTYDSFVGGSNPSDSPASSLGAGRYSDGSPDPNAFGGRASNIAPGNDLSAVSRRNLFYDPIAVNPSPVRSTPLDNNYSSFSQSPWPPQQTLTGLGSAGLDNLTPGRDASQYAPYQDTRSHSAGLGSAGAGAFNTFTPEDPLLPSNYVPMDDTHFQQQILRLPTSSQSASFISTQSPVRQPPQQPAQVSPWGNVVQEQSVRQPVPFNPNFPTGANTVIEQVAPWGTPSAVPRTSKPPGSSPWATVVSDDNVAADPVNGISSGPAPQADSLGPAPVSEPEAQPNAESSMSASTRKTRAKPSVTASPSKAALGATPAAPRPASPAVTAAASGMSMKPVWSKDEDSKPTGVSLSLRDIQDAEAQKKHAEKERERAARANASAVASPSVGDIQSFNTSWGLPTSQTGSRNPAKEASAVSSPAVTNATPVWTTPAKAPAVKKTMKEIQEEEEARKKNAVKESVAFIATRRGYAETTVKQTPPQQVGGVWTTVGPSGKAAASPIIAARPAVTPTISAASPSSVPRANGAVTPSRTNTAPAPPKISTSVAPKVEEFPISPSREFVAWLNDSLQGLHKSVNVEEIMQMLLSFPIDPDASTVELISEMIYSNSNILDGRRFANDFVRKRKADVARTNSGAAGAAASKPVSIAEVVKAQPKQLASEWGGFKVVNKKKKGGRS